jgi:hypothetical protein
MKGTKKNGGIIRSDSAGYYYLTFCFANYLRSNASTLLQCMDFLFREAGTLLDDLRRDA